MRLKTEEIYGLLNLWGRMSIYMPEYPLPESTGLSETRTIMTPQNTPTQKERFFNDNEIIVSKTDLRGVITYCNQVFQDIALYKEEELLGQPHNMIRHPDMPACIFKLLWETVQTEQEIFAYVKNICKNGDHYWVFAHVTPSYDVSGKHIGYHSNRRVPYADALAKVKPLYEELRSIELASGGRKEGMNRAYDELMGRIQSQGLTYSQFVFSLSESTCLEVVHA